MKNQERLDLLETQFEEIINQLKLFEKKVKSEISTVNPIYSGTCSERLGYSGFRNSRKKRCSDKIRNY